VIAYRTSWRDVFRLQIARTWKNQFFHIFLSPGFPPLQTHSISDGGYFIQPRF
jgi:hypothetical protein